MEARWFIIRPACQQPDQTGSRKPFDCAQGRLAPPNQTGARALRLR